MQQERDPKKLERRAKALLLDKEIEPSKMELVRSIMQNDRLLPEEKYSAVIELIQTSPDKPRSSSIKKNTRIEVKGSVRTKMPQVKKTEASQASVYQEPSESGVYISDLLFKYKKLRFFKKRWLIHASNRLGIGFKKRLIPTKRLLKALKEIYGHQEKLLTKLPDILLEILRDQTITDPTHFNYLRQFQKWLSAMPLIKYEMGLLKWLERKDFELEIRDYLINFFSFYLMDAELKEQIIILVESKLRNILRPDGQGTGRSERISDKQNLALEKAVHEYLTIFRFFFSAGSYSDNSLAKHLGTGFGIPPYPQFLKLLGECLFYHKEISFEDIIGYYEITPPRVSAERWDYGMDFLKKFGKDPETQKAKRLARLREAIIPYEELFSFLKLEMSGHNILLKAFEDQWKIVDKRKQDTETIYEDDFFTFIDGCINYFNNCYLPLLNGTTVMFEDKNRNTLEGRIFSSSYFEREVSTLDDILSEINYFRTNNPNLVISLAEAQKILAGQIKSMSHVEAFLKRIGHIFYTFGREFHRLFDIHQRWVNTGSDVSNTLLIRTSLDSREETADGDDAGRPLPFYDCRIKGLQDSRPLTRLLTGQILISDLYNDSLIVLMSSFSYQLAYECMDESLTSDLESRKRLLAEIKELSG